MAIKTYIDGYGYLDMDVVAKIIRSVKPMSNELRDPKEGKEYANDHEILERCHCGLMQKKRLDMMARNWGYLTAFCAKSTCHEKPA